MQNVIMQDLTPLFYLRPQFLLHETKGRDFCLSLEKNIGPSFLKGDSHFLEGSRRGDRRLLPVTDNAACKGGTNAGDPYELFF